MKYLIREKLNNDILYWGEDDFPDRLEENGYYIADIKTATENHVILELIPDN